MDVKKALKAYGHNISSMAKLMGITQQALSQQIVNNSITFAKVEKIAELCNTTTLDFVEAGTDNKKGMFCAFVCVNGTMHTFNDRDGLISFLQNEE